MQVTKILRYKMFYTTFIYQFKTFSDIVTDALLERRRYKQGKSFCSDQVQLSCR